MDDEVPAAGRKVKKMVQGTASKRTSCLDLQSEVISTGLCCGCGACVGVCPVGALAIDIFRSHLPTIDQTKCTECGLCLKVCPGKGYPVNQWVGSRAETGALMSPTRGPVRQYLKGYSTDPDIRLNSASGGVATGLLLHLLETNQVDDVVIVGMAQERPATLVTHDLQVVRESLMSKYGPLPTLATIIPEMRKRPRRWAMTMTPCQRGGLWRAMELIPSLRQNQIFTIGLFCGYIQSYDLLTSLAATLKVQYPGEAKFTAWRAGPYPGSVRFERPDGSAAEKPLYSWLDLAVPHFSLRRCFLCPDGGNWLADLTMGDIHFGGNDLTVVVCRTQRGTEALFSAEQAGRIALENMTDLQVESCVINQIKRSKMLPAISCNSWLKKKGQAAPQFDYDARSLLSGRLRWLAYLWILRFKMIFHARTGWRRRFLLKHPRCMEKTGHFLYYFPATIPGLSRFLKIVKPIIRIARRTGGKAGEARRD